MESFDSGSNTLKKPGQANNESINQTLPRPRNLSRDLLSEETAFAGFNYRTTKRIKSLNILSHLVQDKKRTIYRKHINPEHDMVNDNYSFDTGIFGNTSSSGRQMDIFDMERCLENKISQNIIMDYYSNYEDCASVDNIPVFVLEFGKKDENKPIIPSTSGSDQKSNIQYDIPESPSISISDIGVYNSDIGVGSMVEVADTVNLYYGVVRWIGFVDVDETIFAGVELEEEQSDLSDGTHCGERYFSCPQGRGLFVPITLCRKDGRFQDVPVTPQPDTSVIDFGQMDCPIVPGCIPPLNHTKDLEGLCGKFRGIQGHHNSCYLDATLFSMFTFTSVFDSLLFRPPDSKDSVHYEEVQRVLREEIVNPLRQNLYVRADRVMKLRKLLEKLSSISGLTSEEKDPEEFLNSLVAQILRAEPFLKLNSGQEAFHYQLFVEKDEKLALPSVQQLFEQSFLTSNIKLKEVPSCLIIQMPRFGKSYKMYPRILPSQLLDVTDVIENAPRQCTVCGKLAAFECRECFGQCAVGLESTAFCRPCLDTVHTHSKRANHKPSVLSVPSDFEIMAEHCPVPRLYMELFAVVCIETSHYVAFVKAGSGHEAPWCFFDSMADRKGEQNGYNIPEIVLVDDISVWLSEEGVRSLHEAAPNDKMLPEHAKRLLCDAYMCMYQSPDVSMYR